MKRYLPFALMFVSVGLVYACSSSDETTPTPDGGASSTSSSTSSTSSSGGEGGSDAPTDSPTDAPVTNVNPIEGVGTPTPIATLTPLGVEGPVWRGDSLIFSDYGQKVLVKFTPPTTTNPFRTATDGFYPIGNTYDEKTNTFLSVEAGAAGKSGNIIRTPAAGGQGAPLALVFPLGDDDATALTFDSPNDIVARKSDGMIYVTDPGYQTADQLITRNHIWRISGTAVFETPAADRPNGIALSVDEKTLFVGFSDTAKIKKYPIGTNGALGSAVDFATLLGAVPLNDSVALDGLTIDSVGNVYAAINGGVVVFKPDGTQWGKITIAGKKIGSVALGGADKKTLFMVGNFGNGSYQVTVKVAGR